VFFSVNVGWINVERVVLVKEVVGETGGLKEGFEVEEGHVNSDYLTFRETLWISLHLV
jgi:hypothetical protein